MKELHPQLDGAGLRIGIVVSRFNRDIVDALLAACLNTLTKNGVNDLDITLIRVPGALEIPLTLAELGRRESCDALIALGAVVRGDTYHFEIVSNESASGITQVQLDSGLPIANGILTVDTDEQALARVEEKGVDAALVAIEMANLKKQLAS